MLDTTKIDLNGDAPCDWCILRSKCRFERLACEDCFNYINEIRKPIANRNPTNKWFKRCEL